MAEKRKGSLVKAFAKAAAKVVVGLVLGVSLLYGAWYGAHYPGRGEKLTAGETRMVQQVFGSEINPSRLRKHFRPEDDRAHCVAPEAEAMVLPPFSHIDFYGEKTWSEDYSKDSQSKYALFMHEATHTWQGQNFSFPTKALEIYAYDLTPTARWKDFGAEQQADLVANYSARWLYPKNVQIKHNAGDALLARVVENRFPQAKKTRLALEGTHAVDIDKMIAEIPPPKPGANSAADKQPAKKPEKRQFTIPFRACITRPF